MNGTIYVVTEGDYSNYHICAVFDDKELAELYLSHFGGEIEEWELNPLQKQLRQGRVVWHVQMNQEGGTSYFGVHATERDVPETDKMVPVRMSSLPDYRYAWHLEIECYAENKQHAIKIANERRTQIIALSLWPSTDPVRGSEPVIDPLGREKE